jgi:glutamate--cysteine ligase
MTEIKELEHLMTMFFPDVRTKRYIEIRMMDSIPYPLNFSAVALVKGLFYDDDNLDKLDEFVRGITAKQVVETKVEMLEKGMDAKLNGKTLLQIGKWLLELSRKGLDHNESSYLKPLEDLIGKGKNPYMHTRDRFEEGDRSYAIEWAMHK